MSEEMKLNEVKQLTEGNEIQAREELVTAKEMVEIWGVPIKTVYSRISKLGYKPVIKEDKETHSPNKYNKVELIEGYMCLKEQQQQKRHIETVQRQANNLPVEVKFEAVRSELVKLGEDDSDYARKQQMGIMIQMQQQLNESYERERKAKDKELEEQNRQIKLLKAENEELIEEIKMNSDQSDQYGSVGKFNIIFEQSWNKHERHLVRQSCKKLAKRCGEEVYRIRKNFTDAFVGVAYDYEFIRMAARNAGVTVKGMDDADWIKWAKEWLTIKLPTWKAKKSKDKVATVSRTIDETSTVQ